MSSSSSSDGNKHKNDNCQKLSQGLGICTSKDPTQILSHAYTTNDFQNATLAKVETKNKTFLIKEQAYSKSKR